MPLVTEVSGTWIIRVMLNSISVVLTVACTCMGRKLEFGVSTKMPNIFRDGIVCGWTSATRSALLLYFIVTVILHLFIINL